MILKDVILVVELKTRELDFMTIGQQQEQMDVPDLIVTSTGTIQLCVIFYAKNTTIYVTVMILAAARYKNIKKVLKI